MTRIHYLLDTNICSYIIKNTYPAIRTHLLKVSMSDVFISVITEAELLFGRQKHPGNHALKTAIHEFLQRVNILPWDSDAAKHYAHLRSALELSGKPLGNMDLMIASHALSTNATLVTHDKAFRMIEKLKHVDWTT
jgi:tRNA(fMet)-specific endonuclease VapC